MAIFGIIGELPFPNHIKLLDFLCIPNHIIYYCWRSPVLDFWGVFVIGDLHDPGSYICETSIQVFYSHAGTTPQEISLWFLWMHKKACHLVFNFRFLRFACVYMQFYILCTYSSRFWGSSILPTIVADCRRRYVPIPFFWLQGIVEDRQEWPGANCQVFF